MIDLQTNTTTKTRTDRQLRLTGADLVALVNQELKASGDARRIPTEATVVVNVPGGGDWSNTELDVDERAPVVISWTEIG